MSNQELRFLIKNELEYFKFKNPKNRHKYNIIYKKYKHIIDKHVLFLNTDKKYEKLYCFINNIVAYKKCLICSSEITKFQNGSYSDLCSMECVGKNNSNTNEKQQKIFNKKHNNKFIYDWSTYVNSLTPVRIICPIHGEFWESPLYHVNYECRECKTDTIFNELFIVCNKVHNNKYIYNRKTFTNMHTKMKIICPEHGEFWQLPSIHKIGSGCVECFLLKNIVNQIIPWEKLLIEFNLKHNNKYEYFKETYIDGKTKMKVYCREHNNYFYQSPAKHKQSTGCKYCIREIKRKLLTKDFNYFHKQFILIHDYFYTYDETTYVNAKTKMKIICPIHGDFWQSPSTHRSGCGCPSCKQSKGERYIRNILESMNVEFDEQKRFKDCKYVGVLSFDFYLIDYNICIEYQGKQHYEFVEYFHKTEEKFQGQLLRDKIKLNYCFVNKIKLIRIPYWKQKNIEEILTKEIR